MTSRTSKALLATLLLAALIAAGIVMHSKNVRRLEKVPLSFKPFTHDELLKFQVKIDTKTLGKRVVSAELDGICSRVSQLRNLPFREKPEFVEIDEKQQRLLLLDSLLEESRKGEFELDRRLLVALGLIPEGLDLEKTIVDVLTEQIAGSYDSRSKVITLVKGKGLGEAMDELTIAHEVTHALQDQHFDFEAPPLEDEEYDSENDLAVKSLVEGDAMYVTFAYAERFIDVSTLYESTIGSTKVSEGVLERAPVYIQKSLLFPYESGLNFVMSLMERGGIPLLDKAFKDPPLSSEQIMRPERYFPVRDDPRIVDLEDISERIGKGWRLSDQDTMGSFDVSVWFEIYNGPISADIVSEGWGGNSIQFYEGPEESYLLVNMFRWDTSRDAREFFDEYEEMLKKRFGNPKRLHGDGRGYAYRSGDVVYRCLISEYLTLCIQSDNEPAIEKALDRFSGLLFSCPTRCGKPGQAVAGDPLNPTAFHEGNQRFRNNRKRPAPGSIDPEPAAEMAAGYP